ncbi:MAG: L,D-transpeptidase family protein [Magnetococcales bacterium]|nr:L,D-transpeptidase family protein [Magnetococcales bacterium]
MASLSVCVVVFFNVPGLAATDAMDVSRRSGRVSDDRTTDGNPLERLLIQGLELIGRNRLDEAESTIRRLLTMRPDFRLANVVLGDLLLRRAGGVDRFGAGVVDRDKELADLLAEARVRWDSERRPATNALPGEVLRIPARYSHVVIVDFSRSRLYLFRNWQSIPEKVADYYIAIGKEGSGKTLEGDKKTPIGFYHVTGRMGDDTLPPFYGVGAFPLDYPNAWDQLHQRTGSGIWLHGSPTDTYSRPPRASDGCVVLTNPDFSDLGKSLLVDNPVILTERIEWLEPKAWWQRREQMLQRVNRWRDDWIQKKGEGILRHYSSSYRGTPRMDDGAAWNLLLDGRVDLLDPGLMGYPGDESMMVVIWGEWQTSDSARHGVPMTQYWRPEKGTDWKIVFEPNG